MSIYEIPTYGLAEAAFYLRLPYQTIRQWTADGGVVALSGRELSYLNLLEVHVLNGLRKGYDIPMQRIRAAVVDYLQTEENPHPLLDERLETDGLHLYLHSGSDYYNLNRRRQMAIPAIVSTYLKRIVRTNDGAYQFYPFVVSDLSDEPKNILIAPTVAFGKPVIAGTGISTEVIAGRFLARDSVDVLAQEYEVEPSLIEEAIRWELPHLNAA